jgi:hypothetical protein
MTTAPKFLKPPTPSAPDQSPAPTQEELLTKGLPSLDTSSGLKAVTAARGACNEAARLASAAFAALADPSTYDAESYKAAIKAGAALKEARGALADAIETEFVAPARKVKQHADLILRAALEGPDAVLDAGRTATTAYRDAELARQKADADRKMAEARRAQQLENDHAEALLLDARRDEENRRLARAVAAADSGDQVRAEAILDTPEPVSAPAPAAAAPVFIPPPPPPQVARTEGEVRRTKRTGRVDDAPALLRALADGKVPMLNDKGKPTVTFLQSYLDAAAKTFGDKVGLYLPGVVCVETSDTDFRSTP